jgi:nucleotide-binding universal stress UspA family protein
MYKRLMVVVDKRAVARAAITEGIALAKTHDGEVIFYFAMPLYPMPLADVPPFVVVPPKEYQEAAEEEADRALSVATALAVKAGVRSRVVKGNAEDPVRGIVDEAQRRRCDIIVVASAGRNAVLRLLAGSVIPALITASPIPVLVCKQRPRSSGTARTGPLPLKARKSAAGKRRSAVAG